MNSVAAYLIAQAIVQEPHYHPRTSRGTGISARIRRLFGRPTRLPTQGDTWFEIPPLVGYPPSR